MTQTTDIAKSAAQKSKKKRKLVLFIVFIIALSAIFAASYIADIGWGIKSAQYFGENLWEMLQIVPPAFLLIALFDKWVKREHVIAQMGEASGIKGYLWALLLAGISIGGVYVMFPLAASMSKKGASLKVIFAYMGFTGVCRIPMIMFEVTFLGAMFSVIRLAAAIPLLGLSGMLLGRYLEKRKYRVAQPEQ